MESDGHWNWNFDQFIQVLSESIFKSVLDANKLNTIKFTTESQGTSYIDCSDCRNQWLIRDKRRDQFEAVCKDDISKILFDDEIAEKLKTKCKKIDYLHQDICY